MPNKEASLAELLSEINFKRNDLEAALRSLSGIMLVQAFIVVSDSNIAFKFKIEGNQVTEPSFSGGPHLATRFSRIDAEHIAESITDGNGKHGKAIHVCEAIRQAITRLDEVIAMLTAK